MDTSKVPALVKTDFCKQYGYTAKIMDVDGKEIANPETETDFFEKKIKEFIKESARAYRLDKAREDAAKTVPEITI